MGGYDQALGLFAAAFPGVLMRFWIRSGVGVTSTGHLYNADVAGKNLTGCATSWSLLSQFLTACLMPTANKMVFPCILLSW